MNPSDRKAVSRAMSAWGRLGGSARAESLTPERRTEIARAAVNIRWLRHEELKIAERLFWWKKPRNALKDRKRFITQVMTFGTWDDVRWVESHTEKALLQEAIDQPLPGIFDPRSWAFWNVRLGRNPDRPLPKRKIV